jgi:peptide/nickel transport system substrate-binding protein
MAVGLLAGACGDNGGESAGTGGGQPEGPGGGDATELTIAIGSEPENLDPHAIRAGTDSYFAINVFERLLERNVEGELVPGLATEYSVSEDGKAFTFELRQGAKFHNGDPVTAEDVKYSFERYVDPELGNVFAFLLDKLDHVEIVDQDTVIVHLTEFDGQFLPGGAFAYIVPKNYIETNGTEHFAENPVGTGPLKFVERRIRESFTLDRFDEYWGEKAGYGRYVFRIASDANARVAAIRSGAVSLISQVPPQNLEQLQGEQGLKVEDGYTAENVWVKFGTLDGGVPWADDRVREAMDLAIDKEAIIEEVVNGLGVTYTGVAPISAGVDRADYDLRPYDPDRAKELLAEAGYADGFDINIATPVNGRLPASEQTMQAVAGYWSEVGINANVQVLEYSQWIEAINISAPPLDGAALGLHGDYTTRDPQYRMQTHLLCGGPYSFVCDPEFDAHMAAVATTVDETARQDAYLEAYKYAYADKTYEIPLYSSEQAYAMAENVCWVPMYGSAFVDAARAKPC